MNAAVHHLETRLDRLWREWLEARSKAMTSNSFADGVEAGRAWSRWLAEFEPGGNNKRAAQTAENAQ